jgi:GcrA cell cycle regulator
MQEFHGHARRVARSAWTEAQIQQLRQRWSKGVSAARIARELGGGISRNAVLAKIRRLGAVGPGRRRPSLRKGIRAASSHAIPDRLPFRKIAGEERPFPAWIADAKPYVDDPGADADIPPQQRRSFLDLSSHACRWPVGDPTSPDFFFCGAQSLVGKPYCTDHCARAYRGRDVAHAER